MRRRLRRDVAPAQSRHPDDDDTKGQRWRGRRVAVCGVSRRTLGIATPTQDRGRPATTPPCQTAPSTGRRPITAPADARRGRRDDLVDNGCLVRPRRGAEQARSAPDPRPPTGCRAPFERGSASASTSPAGTSSASSPTSSGMPPTAVATTGSPTCMASWTTSARASQTLDSARTSAARSRSATSCARPEQLGGNSVRDDELSAPGPHPVRHRRPREPAAAGGAAVRPLPPPRSGSPSADAADRPPGPPAHHRLPAPRRTCATGAPRRAGNGAATGPSTAPTACSDSLLHEVGGGAQGDRRPSGHRGLDAVHQLSP